MSKIIFYSKYFPNYSAGSKRKNNGKKGLSEYWILHSEGKTESENSIFSTLNKITDLGKHHQLMLTSLTERMLRNRELMWSERITSWIIY